MKSMTCKQLGGACEERFSAATFDEIARLSMQHGKEKFAEQDAEHLAAMDVMQQLMQDPQQMQQWMDDRRNEFDQLPEE